MNRMREALQEIWDGPCSCSLCRQRLPPSAVSCLGGHVFCVSCRRGLSGCIFCKKQFSTEAHEAFRRVLETLPKCCKFMGCFDMPEDLSGLKEHETWCGHRPAVCRLCNWSEQAKDLYSHCLRQHSNHRSQNAVDAVVSLTQDQTFFCLMSTYDQVFWVTCSFTRATGYISIQVVWEPDGTFKCNLFEARVSFEFGGSSTSMAKKIEHKITESAEQASLFQIPLTSVKNFFVDDTVKFRLSIIK